MERETLVSFWDLKANKQISLVLLHTVFKRGYKGWGFFGVGEGCYKLDSLV